MSRLSDLFITIQRSPDYRRLAWILTGWAIACVYYVHFPLLLGLTLVGSMLSALWHITQVPMPHLGLQTLAFQRGKWIISFGAKTSTYDKIQICVDTGLFLLLHFSGSQEHKSRWLVLFYDQLSPEELRHLYVAETISRSNKPREESKPQLK